MFLPAERFLYRCRSGNGFDVHNPFNLADDFNFDAGTIRHGRNNFFAAKFFKLADWAGVVYDIYFGLHVDLSASLVYVADML